jgi:hypothetical protein
MLFSWVSNSLADSLTGTYTFNANSNIGALVLKQSGNRLTGKMIFYINRNGEYREQPAKIENAFVKDLPTQSKLITFKRSGDNQVYTGHVSWDGKLIAGKFGAPNKSNSYWLPWIAERR